MFKGLPLAEWETKNIQNFQQKKCPSQPFYHAKFEPLDFFLWEDINRGPEFEGNMCPCENMCNLYLEAKKCLRFTCILYTSSNCFHNTLWLDVWTQKAFKEKFGRLGFVFFLKSRPGLVSTKSSRRAQARLSANIRYLPQHEESRDFSVRDPWIHGNLRGPTRPMPPTPWK